MQKKRTFWIAATLVAAAMVFLFSPLADSVTALFSDAHAVDVLWRVRDEIMQKSTAGQYYEALFWKHSSEQVQILENHPEHYEEFWRLTRMFVPGLEALLDGKGDTVRITEEQVKSLQAELDWYASVGSPSFREDIKTEQQRFPLENFVGMTMSEALDHINSNWPPELTAESITPTEAATQTPGPISTPICVAGYDSNCLAGPSLVPNSDGQWAYYVSNGIYFEYPSTWHLEEKLGVLFLLPTPDSPESSSLSPVYLVVWILPNQGYSLYDPLDSLTGLQYRPIIWNRPVSLPDFEGAEFLWNDQNAPACLEVFLYAENAQIVVELKVYIIDDQITELLDNPNAVNEIFPDFQHITESFRIRKP
jgi:hypothetical protein